MSRIGINKDDPLKLKKVTLAWEGILMIFPQQILPTYIPRDWISEPSAGFFF